MVNLHNHKFYCTTISFTDIQDMMRKGAVTKQPLNLNKLLVDFI